MGGYDVSKTYFMAMISSSVRLISRIGPGYLISC